MKKNNKIISKILLLIASFIMIFQTVFAAELSNIFDVRVEDTAYTSSHASDIILPYVRAMTGKLVLDKNVAKSGINITKDKIEIAAEYTGVQIFISETEIIFTGKVDQAIVIAPKISIKGSSTNTIVAIGKNIDVEEEAKLNDLIVKSWNTNANGEIAGNLLGSSTKIDIKGSIGKDLRIETQRIDVLANKILGEVVIDTFNPTLTVKYAYPEAKINVLEKSTRLTKEELNVKIIKELKLGIIAVLSFTLIFLMFRTLIHRDKLVGAAKLVRKHILFTVVMGVLGLMLIPVDIAIFTFLIFAGIKEIGVAALLLYIAFVVALYLIAPFIVGTILYLSIKKYIIHEKKELVKDIIAAIVIFIILYGITRIPVFGTIIKVIYLIITLGSIVTIISKKLDGKL